MIVKKIPATGEGQGAASRSVHVRHLVDYIKQPDKPSPYREHLLRYLQEEGIVLDGVERLLHLKARNFITEDLLGQRAEMMATAQAAVRSNNPLDHWLLSWREGERPTERQIDQAAAIFLHDLGLSLHQAIYAVHGDTHNVHMHIAVNRYHALDRRVVEINGGWSLEAAHAAVARIVGVQGWQPEANARYVLVDGKPRRTDAATAARRAGDRPIGRPAGAYESRTGLRSPQRIAQEEAWPEIEASRSWRDLHRRLAARGFGYERVGSDGALITIGDRRVNSSMVHKRATVTRIEERLKEKFKARDHDIIISPRDPQRDPLPGAFLADDYRADVQARRANHQDHKRQRDALACDLAAHRAKARSQRRAVAAADWAGREALRDVLLDELRKFQREKEEEDLMPRRRRGNAAADYEEWLRQRGEHYLAERWRHRNNSHVAKAQLDGTGKIVGLTPEDIDGYHARRTRDAVLYAKNGEPTAFIDHGSRIEVVPGLEDAAILAALRLAKMRYGHAITVTGGDIMRRRIFAMAHTHGLGDAISNAEYHSHYAVPDGSADRLQGDQDVSSRFSLSLLDEVLQQPEPEGPGGPSVEELERQLAYRRKQLGR